MLASAFSDEGNPQGRDVFAVDYRGRGRSAHDPNWRNYTLQIETLDVFDFMTVTGLHEAAILGTSRGGLIAMLMATMRPTSIGAVVLNDIGPVIERDGIMRIMAYTGRIPLPNSWPEAAHLVQDLNKRYFPTVTAAEWAEIAHDWFDDVNGRPANSYDQNLAKAVSLLDGPIPELWPQFEALSFVPTLAVRGALSDLLSEATLHEMRVRHPRLEAITVRAQGHAPLLRDAETLTAISDFLVMADDFERTGSEPRVS